MATLPAREPDEVSAMKRLALTDEDHRARIALALLLAVLIHCRIDVPVRAADTQVGKTSTDRSLFPKAYGILANEELMFPVDMSDWPVKITSQRQLFVDDPRESAGCSRPCTPNPTMAFTGQGRNSACLTLKARRPTTSFDVWQDVPAWIREAYASGSVAVQ